MGRWLRAGQFAKLSSTADDGIAMSHPSPSNVSECLAVERQIFNFRLQPNSY